MQFLRRLSPRNPTWTFSQILGTTLTRCSCAREIWSLPQRVPHRWSARGGRSQGYSSASESIITFIKFILRIFYREKLKQLISMMLRRIQVNIWKTLYLNWGGGGGVGVSHTFHAQILTKFTGTFILLASFIKSLLINSRITFVFWLPSRVALVTKNVCCQE